VGERLAVFALLVERGLILGKILVERAMLAHLEDRFGFNGLELGLEGLGALDVGGWVGAAARLGQVVVEIFNLVAWMAPGGYAMSDLGSIWVVWMFMWLGVDVRGPRQGWIDMVITMAMIMGILSNLPISLAASVLLDLVWSSVDEAMLSKVLGHMLDFASGLASVVAVVELMGAGH
jgi:hypothetical protein